MSFLAQGDYSFPIGPMAWPLYWVKYFYTWSFQTGTPNPDGIIRLAERSLNFLVFEAFGSLGVSYFYIFSSLLIAFLSFFFFVRNFLKIKNLSIQIIGGLFFALNPIFLGNVAKIGLVLAAAMLPLALLSIKKAFDSGKIRYFLFLVLCINLSFMHPYTLAVNVVVSLAYLIYKALENKQFIRANLPKLAGCLVVGLLLNAYFIFPTLSLGTVSKDVISDNVTPISADYTALVDVSNTGNIFTGLSLSKNVFVDFNFYNDTYKTTYFVSIYAFYMILIGLYLRVHRRMESSEKTAVFVMLMAFLVVTALATTTFLGFDKLIKILIHMPGGWAFRSPLKWQLYIPIMLFGSLVMLLNRVITKRRLRIIEAALLGTFVLMNGYIAVDIYKKILTPRTYTHFSAMAKMSLDNKTILFVNSNECTTYMSSNPRITTELNQVFTSVNAQLKRVEVQDADSINIGSYDYVLTCKDPSNFANELMNTYGFSKPKEFDSNIFAMYTNTKSQPGVYAASEVYSQPQPANIASRYQFVANTLGTPLTFTTAPPSAAIPVANLQDVFGGISPSNLQTNAITTTAQTGAGQTIQLNATPAISQPLYYSMNGNNIQFSSTPQDGWQTLDVTHPISAPANQKLTLTYQSSGYNYKNLVNNPSLEQGLWQKTVSDCYDYDANPQISMTLTKAYHVDGKQALQLNATRHIACTGPSAISVTPGAQYLISFDYQSPDGGFAGYHLGFNDKADSSTTRRLTQDGSGWHTFSEVVTVPAGASKMRLQVYAYSNGLDGTSNVTVRYDDVSIIQVPPVQDMLYLLGGSSTATQKPQKVTYSVVNPTKKIVQITGAKQPFYLLSAESYDKSWGLGLAQDDGMGWFDKTIPVSSKQHFSLDGTMNGWYVNPAALCQQHGAHCTRNQDGSYNFAMVMEYKGQKAFYVGLMVSAVTFGGCLIYFGRVVYIAYQDKRKRNGKAEK